MHDEMLLEFNLHDWRPAGPEKLARKGALQDALRKALAEPLAVHTLSSSTCVILFGQFAYLNREGVLAAAQHDRGVLTEVEGYFPEPLNSLAVRPTAAGVRELAKNAIYLEAARSLAAWGGGLVELTGNWDSDWTPGLSPTALTELSDMDALSAVSCVPMAVWGQIAKRFAAMLAVDRSLVCTSRWAILGASNPLDAYDQLRRSAFHPLDISPGVERRLVAHAISASIEAREKHQNVDDAVKRFRARLTKFGVRPSGFALLVDTPLGYWRKVLQRGGYDFTTIALTLLLGQRLTAPRLPNAKFVEAIRNIDFDNELDPYLRRVPVRIWREAYQRFSTAPSDAMPELGNIIPWAAKLGAAMPKFLQESSWEILLELATEQIANEVMFETISVGPRHTTIFEDGESTASLMPAEHAVDRICKSVDVRLEYLRQEIEARIVKVFYARSKFGRAVILLRARGVVTGWMVDHVRGAYSQRPDPRFVSFAERLCRWYNRVPSS